MKTICILFVLCLLFCYPAVAQVKFGVKAGVMAADVHAVNFPPWDKFDTKARLSFQAGGFSHISINPRFSLLMELLYANKGYSTEGADVKTNYYFHYINLPVLLNYEVFENLYLGIGPELGYLIAEKGKDGLYGRSFIHDNPLDVGLDAGIEYKPIEFLKVGVRYNYGFSNVYPDNLPESWAITITDSQGNLVELEPAKMQNRVFQLYIGYTFKSRK